MIRKKVAAATLALLMGSGCTPQGPETPAELPPENNTSTEKDGVSYERAKERAEELLTRYLQVTDEITSEGGQSPDRIRGLVSSQWFETERQDFEAYRNKKERTVGVTTFDSLVLQVVRTTAERDVDVSVFACVDSSDVFVLGPGVPDPPPEVMAWHPRYENFAGTEEEQAIIDTYFVENEVRFGQRQPVVFWLRGESLDSLVIDSQEQWWGEHPC